MKCKPGLVALIGSLALAACTPAAQQTEFKTFTQQTIDGWLTLDPSFAVYQGAHQFDGKLPDWSEAGLKAQADFLKQTIAKAGAYTELSETERFQRDYIVAWAKGELFWLETADFPHSNPDWYADNFDPNVYLSREYADKTTRMRALTAFLESVPAAAANLRANLRTPLPASFVSYGISAFGGYADFYPDDVPKAFAGVGDAAQQQALATAAAKAGKAMAELRDWFEDQQPNATRDFALGPEKFSAMLRDTELVDVPLDELERAGRADLARNQAALKAACADFAPGATIQACMVKLNANKPDGGPVAEATRQIPELTDFVRQNKLVTIPGTEQALVRESPPYNRQNSAYIDPPGPFEKGIPSIYYISPPDPAWPLAKQQAFVPGKQDLMFTTVHEIMPGHFLQFLHSNRSPSLFGRLNVGYAFAEGWAHYSEEMMIEAGFGAGNPEARVGQLSNALLRNCRYLSAIGLHTRGMTQDQAKQMFMTDCFQDEGNAEQQAARGTYEPAYINYTLGKLLIRKLREDWTASRGGRQAWQQFHDGFLAFGGPPIPLVRQAMMQEEAPRTVF